ncbi:hypothetical protein XENOCAPTIV_024880 [Xenoophorus captivus]|uniref:Uncharacterized protein n=1 Tax=Xenoophorus captivus TaxID=1517983 RepID=A0ABV0QEC8_9TELE
MKGKSPVISGADSRNAAPTENSSSPLLGGRNYCTHSGTTSDKTADGGSKHCYRAPAVHIFITLCSNWLMVAFAFGSAQTLRGGTSSARRAFIRSVQSASSSDLSLASSPM